MSANEPLRIGPIRLGAPLLLAPMADVTNAPFRALCREQASRALRLAGLPSEGRPTWAPAGLYVCEMITARALVERRDSAWRLVAPDEEEKTRSVQLHGVDPATMGLAARMLVAAGRAHHVDLNFGCPVPKVTRKGGGSALPWKSTRFAEIVRATVTGARQGSEEAGLDFTAPVTVKIRSGIDADHRSDRDAALIAQDEGAAAVCLHARTTSEYYSGSAHWDHIGALVDALDIPVIGNGDVVTGADALAMLADTGCAGVEVGRAAQGRPWVFFDLAAALVGLDAHAAPDISQVTAIILEHADRLVAWGGDEGHAMRDMRKHVLWYLRGFQVGSELKRQLATVSTREELRGLLAQIDPDQPYPDAARGFHGRRGSPRKPRLPHGWLETREVDAAAEEILGRAALETDFSY